MPDASFAAPRGTNDIVPPASWRWLWLERLALDDVFARAGYAPIETPAFEHTEVFERGVGETTEVVTKQMYTFTDRGGRSLTLRPEGTAPVVRAVLERNLHRGPLPVKLSYAGPMFRQERPQKGRYRQFFQIGVEAIGSDDPRVDAEVVEIAVRFLRRAGVEPALLLNSIGHPDGSCRHGYLASLVTYLEAHEGDLAPDDRDRLRTNPLRTFDSKEPATVEIMSAAPVIADHLCAACARHFDAVRGHLADLGVTSAVEPKLVRGLDYYTRTAFELVAPGLGAQNAVGGGGRYDGLSESLGGPPLPGIGFALGVDRILLSSAAEAPQAAIDCYVVAVGANAAGAALVIATRLRAAGVGCDLDLAGRGMKGQMAQAGKSGARWAVIVGDRELETGRATIKDLRSGEQTTVALDALEERLAT